MHPERIKAHCTNKRAYTKKKAKRALKRVPYRRRLDIYRCKICNAWHLGRKKGER